VRTALIAVALTAAALTAVGAAPARAGEYWVHACTDSDPRNDALAASWTGHASVAPATGCFPPATTTGGLRMGAFSAYADGAAWGFCAPAGTRVTRWSASHSTSWFGAGYTRQVDTGPCGGFGVLRRDPLPPGASAGSESGWLDWSGSAAAAGIRFTTWCTLDPCTGAYAFTHLRNLHFLIDDPSPPSLTNERGLFGQAGWVRGDWDVAFDAADSTGIRAMEARVDQDAWTVDNPPCQPDDSITSLTPCEKTTSSLSRSLDTRTLSDGDHALTLWAEDGARNRTGPRSHAFKVDNTAPSAAGHVIGREVWWTVADAGSGVDAASLDAAWSADGGATWQPMADAAWDAPGDTFSARVPAGAGDGVVRVRLTGADNARPGGNRLTSVRVVRLDETQPTGFGDRTANPGTTFTAARQFGTPCPDAATIAADRTKALTDVDLLVGFPLPAAPDCSVASATLRLHASSAATRVDVTRASSSWDPGTVDWETRPGTVGATATATGAPGWIEWDVTAQVEALYRTGDNGLWVRGAAADRPAELVVRFTG
jgi:hypothetical protein